MKMKQNGSAKLKVKDGVIQKPKKSKKLEEAEKAVARYEEMKEELSQMREEFKEKYPKAYEMQEDMKKLEDDIREQIDACKLLVRSAEQSIGEFTCTLKYTSEGYVGARVLEMIAKLPKEEAGELLQELYERGFFADVKVDSAAAKVIRVSDPELRDRLEEAWDKGGDKLTPAVSVPKL